MPFRLISPTVLSEDTPKIEKTDFYKNKFGDDKYTKMTQAVTNWGNENGVPMCTDLPFLKFSHAY